jgi:hypothetical protein
LAPQHLGAATLIQNDTCQGVFDEIETESPKRLEKSVPQHIVTTTLIQNDTCQVVFVKLILNCPNDWKNWCHNIQMH